MQKKTRIMIADDEERLRMTLGKLLSNRGLDVTTLANGQEVLERLKEETFEVVLLDVRMPGMSGLETLARIRELDANVEVILLTGHASVEVAREATRLGAYDYLLKPCSVEEIILRIESACERKGERAGRNGNQAPKKRAGGGP
jgi:DNA-binding NtrC family response regulator